VVLAPDIPGHRVAGVLGTGGFATVYRSWQLAVGREVAVKVDNRVLLSERDRRRFLREVTAAGRLSGHPHVIDVYDAGTLGDGRPYLVMELCPAGSLNDALRRHGPMSAAQVRDIGIRICDALAAAHAAGVLHRDIKPANILVNRYGMVGLSDFGLASIMAAGGEQSATRDALTPAYASPETFRSEEPTAAADIYSLAATLYALLAGRPPRFPAGEMSPSLMAIMMLHDKPVEDVPGAPPELMALLRQGLAADPAARLGSAAALRDALAALSGRPAQAARPPAQAAPPSGPLVPAAGPAAVAAVSAGESSAARSTSGGANGSTAGGVHAGLTTRRGRVVRPIAAAVGLVVIVAVAAIIGVRVLPHGGPGTAAGTASAGNRAAPQVFGIPTVTSGCPAASVPVAAARCPQSPECWDGLVIDSGNATAASLPCGQPHSWETFAIAILPADVRTYDYELVAANRVVRTVCSMPVLLKSRLVRARQIPERAWEIDVLPPDQAAFDSGARAYRCVAHRITRPAPRTAQFGP
jgi:Protein kinase domain